MAANDSLSPFLPCLTLIVSSLTRKEELVGYRNNNIDKTHIQTEKIIIKSSTTYRGDYRLVSSRLPSAGGHQQAVSWLLV